MTMLANTRHRTVAEAIPVDCETPSTFQALLLAFNDEYRKGASGEDVINQLWSMAMERASTSLYWPYPVAHEFRVEAFDFRDYLLPPACEDVKK